MITYIISTIQSCLQTTYDCVASIVHILNMVRNGSLDPLLPYNYIMYRLRELVAYIFENGLVIRHKKYTHILYYDGDTRYRIVIPKTRTRVSIAECYDVDGNDITELLMEYMGPHYNFHGHKITPEMIGHEHLCIVYKCGTNVVIKKDEHIPLTTLEREQSE